MHVCVCAGTVVPVSSPPVSYGVSFHLTAKMTNWWKTKYGKFHCTWWGLLVSIMFWEKGMCLCYVTPSVFDRAILKVVTTWGFKPSLRVCKALSTLKLCLNLHVKYNFNTPKRCNTYNKFLRVQYHKCWDNILLPWLHAIKSRAHNKLLAFQPPSD